MSATYHCEQCGRRYVGPGDLPFTCPHCQTPNQPPRRPPGGGAWRRGRCVAPDKGGRVSDGNVTAQIPGSPPRPATSPAVCRG